MFAAMFLVYESFIILLICMSLYVTFCPHFFLNIEFQIIDGGKNQLIAADLSVYLSIYLSTDTASPLAGIMCRCPMCFRPCVSAVKVKNKTKR